MKFNASTPMRFYKKDSEYIPGQGQEAAWVDVGLLYGEWRGAYGERVTAAQALGVNDSATVRTFYHPIIYEALRSSQVVIAKNADASVIKHGEVDKNNPNAYELWSGVDNVFEQNQFLEFRVRRYEGK